MTSSSGSPSRVGPRELERLNDTLGMFINTVPLRVRVKRGQPALRWLAAHAVTRHRLLDHQYTPLTAIHSQSEITARTPLFDTVVVFENYPDPAAGGNADAVTQVGEVHYETRTNYAVTLIVHTGAEMRLQAIFDAGQFAADEAEAIVAYLATVLGRLVRFPDAAVAEILAVPDPVRTLVVDEWNGRRVDHTPPRGLLSELLTTGLAERPDHLAVIDEEVQYTYRQLDQRADARPGA